MAKQRIKRYLEATTGKLLAPLIAVLPAIENMGWRLITIESEQGLCLTFQNGNSIILIEFENINEQKSCFQRTKYFNVYVRRPFSPRDEISEEEDYITKIVTMVVAQGEKDFPEFTRPAISRKAEIREIEVDQVLMREGRNHYYLNPYVGCSIGCSFCYVAEKSDLSRRLEGLPYIPWGRYVDIKVNAPEILRKEIEKYPPGIVRFCPIISDPYQPAERKYRVTRQCLEILLEGGFTPAVLTRSASVLEDIELLSQFERAGVGFSIPTDDDKMRRLFEPGADPVDERFDALEKCFNAGFITYCLIQPILPMNVDNVVNRIAPFVYAAHCERMNVIKQVRQIYIDNDIEYAATDEFLIEHENIIKCKFSEQGISIDMFNNLMPLLGGKKHR